MLDDEFSFFYYIIYLVFLCLAFSVKDWKFTELSWANKALYILALLILIPTFGSLLLTTIALYFSIALGIPYAVVVFAINAEVWTFKQIIFSIIGLGISAGFIYKTREYPKAFFNYLIKKSESFLKSI